MHDEGGERALGSPQKIEVGVLGSLACASEPGEILSLPSIDGDTQENLVNEWAAMHGV